MSLARELWTANADLAARAVEHSFVRGLADGSLPRETFAGYVAQDAFFLEAFARGYALCVVHSPDRTTLDAFADLLAGVREELRLHDTYAAQWGIDLAAVEPAPATSAYTDFLLATASRGRLPQTCAAMTPCMRLYAHLGAQLAQARSGGSADTYAEWVNTYADPAFEELARTLERLLDSSVMSTATDTADVRRAYRRAMALEVAFFDAAWNGC